MVLHKGFGKQRVRSFQCVGDTGSELEAVSLESLGRVAEIIVCGREGKVEFFVGGKNQIRVCNSRVGLDDVECRGERNVLVDLDAVREGAGEDAARQIAFAEDAAIFEGYAAAGIGGIREGTSNPILTLPGDVREYPDAIAQSLSRLRLVGVNGPYAVLLGADAYTALAETSDHGYPVLEHVKRLVKDQIIWAPAIAGAFVLTTRGGDFDLHIGQDVSIGYLSHTDAAVTLYLQETFTFLLLTTEAAVALVPPAKAKKTS